MKTIIVICAIDDQIEGVKEISEQIEGIGAEVGIATYGNKYCKPSVGLKAFSEEKNYKFFDSPRQLFVPLDREFHCSEMVAYLGISKHFYSMGYDSVYICHHDIRIEKNPLPNYEKEMKGKWSFVVAWRECREGEKISIEQALERTKTKSGFEMIETNIRLSHEFLIFNKKFVEFLYKKYKTDKELWDNLFKGFDMHSDLAMFDFYPTFEGFKAKIIDSCVVHGLKENLRYAIENGKLIRI